ncbi:uncharacterized protein LOC113371102 [Ctenocephalides felis]|uniref:uncharacterized protein LOC113371102 n=1 Tax=Ctenocephalides felis TaxID=7515 RepID=UPI000E6E51AD|nr:uncharacterized protein LOC113371102 [Ctenocephalides felis]
MLDQQPSLGAAIQGLWSDFLLQIEQMSQRLQQTFQILSGSFPLFEPTTTTTTPSSTLSTSNSQLVLSTQEQSPIGQNFGPVTFPNINDENNNTPKVHYQQNQGVPFPVIPPEIPAFSDPSKLENNAQETPSNVALVAQ